MRTAAACLIFSLLVPSLVHGWDRRWRHAESRVSSEPEFDTANVTLFGDLVLVSEPYLASHCSEIRVHAGRVVAFERSTGRTAWVREVAQTTGDQAAYLRAHVAGDLVVYETWQNLRAFDAAGRVVWQRSTPMVACAGGPTQGPWRDVRRAGYELVWSDGSQVCTLDLRSGRVAEGVVRRLPPPRPPRVCLPRRGTAPFVVGAACDRNTRARAEVDASGRFWVRGSSTAR